MVEKSINAFNWKRHILINSINSFDWFNWIVCNESSSNSFICSTDWQSVTHNLNNLQTVPKYVELVILKSDKNNLNVF